VARCPVGMFEPRHLEIGRKIARNIIRRNGIGICLTRDETGIRVCRRISIDDLRPSRYTRYPATPTLSVEICHVRKILVCDLAVAVKPVGTVGGSVSAGGGVVRRAGRAGGPGGGGGGGGVTPPIFSK